MHEGEKCKCYMTAPTLSSQGVFEFTSKPAVLHTRARPVEQVVGNPETVSQPEAGSAIMTTSVIEGQYA